MPCAKRRIEEKALDHEGNLALWHPVRMLREAEATVSRAVERGWIVLWDEVSGKAKRRRAVLTEVDRLLARKSLS